MISNIPFLHGYLIVTSASARITSLSGYFTIFHFTCNRASTQVDIEGSWKGSLLPIKHVAKFLIVTSDAKCSVQDHECQLRSIIKFNGIAYVHHVSVAHDQ